MRRGAKYGTLLLWLPVVLGVHNAEEWLGREKWLRREPQGRLGYFCRPCVVGAAMVGVTLAAVGLVWAAIVSRGSLFRAVSRAAIFGLLVNGFGHALFSVRHREMVLGSWSAVLLVIPYSAIAVVATRDDLRDSPRALLGYAGVGALGMPVVIGACLLMGAGWCRGREKFGVLFRE